MFLLHLYAFCARFCAQREPICNDGVVMDALWAQMADYRFCNQLGRPFGAARRLKKTITARTQAATRHLPCDISPNSGSQMEPNRVFPGPPEDYKSSVFSREVWHFQGKCMFGGAMNSEHFGKSPEIASEAPRTHLRGQQKTITERRPTPRGTRDGTPARTRFEKGASGTPLATSWPPPAA